MTQPIDSKGQLAVLALSCVLAAAAACSDEGEKTEVPVETPGIERITDVNEAPDIVEVQLVAEPTEVRYLTTGPAQIWAYRDGAKPGAKAHVPGPLIEAKQGDKVIVHFRNALPEGTTLHWHGIKVPNASDGTPATQVEVPPGGEFRYEFEARDEGTFWYHPHVRGDIQIERGLYGMLVVHGGPPVPVRTERVLLLDDVKLNASGTLSASTTSLDIMLGRLGNFLLANGLVNPTLPVESGSRERWRLVNTSNGRYLNLRLPGHTFQVIGWDGGLLELPYATETLLIAPGERYDVLVEPRGAVGSRVSLETVYYDRGHDVPDPGPEPILQLAFAGASSTDMPPLPSTWGAPAALTVPPNPARRTLVFEEQTIGGGEDVRFSFSGKAFPDGLVLEATERDVEVWTLRNDTEMDHPFHLHGHFFRVLDVSGTPPAHRGWKDTVNVPKKSTVQLAVQYGEPGAWMYHCHILEHAERGMMGTLRIAQAAQPGGGAMDGGVPIVHDAGLVADAGLPHELDAAVDAGPGMPSPAPRASDASSPPAPPAVVQAPDAASSAPSDDTTDPSEPDAGATPCRSHEGPHTPELEQEVDDGAMALPLCPDPP